VQKILEAGTLRDSDPQVRLLSLLALADQPPSSAAGEAILAALANPLDARDRWIGDAATCAAANNGEFFLKALAAKKTSTQRLLGIATIVADHYARGGPKDSVGSVIATLA